MKYVVNVEETLSKSFIVNASSKEEAENIIRKAYFDSNIILGGDDFINGEIQAQEADIIDIKYFPEWNKE